ncbi:putative TetR transcriptional regulator [Vibrio phage vB_VchM-138]|uniref:Putative transcriptional regulator n=2 Tax=unclassified Caudoviricetes TaxID=2788787 RepID=A0A5Q2WCB1_9CAUD|nr:putative TetR transcriptional regulator [Vibrio phage vB_VchM-138]AFC22693.1 putative TetR transcriptional regulator [Vibrio phage vB_VchM-138]AIA08751.1 putative transcriptional regulator [Vibrio phage 24]QGH75018.1 putative transcriptional regulator [Vibrio phage Rostov M3]
MKKMQRGERAEMLIDGAIRVIAKNGWDNLTRELVATECGVATGTVSFAFGTMEKLRDALITHAIERHTESDTMLHIIGKGLASGNEIARNAPADVKQAALNQLM